VNLSSDDDIRNQRERGRNQHGPLAGIAPIVDCDLIHVVEVTGANPISRRAVVVTNHVEAEAEAEAEGQTLCGPAPRVVLRSPAVGGQG
jgi:hypothetical protein